MTDNDTDDTDTDDEQATEYEAETGDQTMTPDRLTDESLHSQPEQGDEGTTWVCLDCGGEVDGPGMIGHECNDGDETVHE